MKLNPIFAGVLAMIPAAALVALGVRHAYRSVPPLPVRHPVGAFTLTEKGGRMVSRDDLRGKVWIADFIFTNCAGTCPTMTAHLAQVEDALREVSADVRLVSFTVDPERDTPERLTEYAKTQGAGEGWLFLRGSREEVARLSREGFFLGTAPPSGAEPGTEPIAHDRHFVLVDRQGRICGYYDGTDPAAVAEIARAARALLREPPPAP